LGRMGFDTLTRSRRSDASRLRSASAASWDCCAVGEKIHSRIHMAPDIKQRTVEMNVVNKRIEKNLSTSSLWLLPSHHRRFTCGDVYEPGQKDKRTATAILIRMPKTVQREDQRWLQMGRQKTRRTKHNGRPTRSGQTLRLGNIWCGAYRRGGHVQILEEGANSLRRHVSEWTAHTHFLAGQNESQNQKSDWWPWRKTKWRKLRALTHYTQCLQLIQVQFKRSNAPQGFDIGDFHPSFFGDPSFSLKFDRVHFGPSNHPL